jgi:DNA-binding XRE family transcriptional regulator
LSRNIIRKIREDLLIGKAELARKAGLAVLTLNRVEQGKPCRMETQRKIIEALGYDISDKSTLFPDN